MSRWPGLLLLAVVATLAVLGVGAVAHVRYHASQSRLPEQGRTAVDLPGLAGPVVVRVDRSGVPHLTAESEADLWFALGYVHARERFFQMELARRAATGRLAEIMGGTALPLDRKLRTWRIAATASRQRNGIGAEEEVALTAYAAGVNAALDRYGSWIAPELGVLGIGPEPWRIEDSLGIGVLFQINLTFAMGEELDRAVELAHLGRRRALDLWGWSEGQARAWIPGGPSPSTAGRRRQEAITPPFGGVGSNNWAIAPGRAAHGRPLVANDPHIGVEMPGTWYGVHLKAPGLAVAGVSIPGAPGVIIGHNDRAAWGFTMAMLDDQDLYRLKVDRQRKREFVDGRWVPMQVVTEKIRVRGRANPATVVIRISHVGPVVRDRAGEVLALHWTALEGPTPLGAFLRMDRAGTVGELQAAWRDVVGPAMNMVAADVDGHIAHQVVGKVPVRGRGAGRLPAPGEDSRWGWTGYRPLAANPRTIDPEAGFVATANHDLFSEGDYPEWMRFPADFASPWRVRRIRSRLAARDDWTVQACLDLQGDLLSGRARAVLKLIRPELQKLGGRSARALLAWDGVMRAGALAPHLYSRLMNELGEAVGGDEQRSTGLRETVFTQSRLVRLLGGGLDETWWDDVTTPGKETREAVIAGALRRLDELHLTAPWGAVHRVGFDHPFARAPLLGTLFGRAWSRGPFPVGGDGTTVNAHYWKQSRPYAVTAIPSMRFVTEVGAWDETVLVLPVGNSGRPWSGHYDDDLEPWLDVKPIPLPFSAEAVAAATRARLDLIPIGGRRPGAVRAGAD